MKIKYFLPIFFLLSLNMVFSESSLGHDMVLHEIYNPYFYGNDSSLNVGSQMAGWTLNAFSAASGGYAQMRSNGNGLYCYSNGRHIYSCMVEQKLNNDNMLKEGEDYALTAFIYRRNPLIYSSYAYGGVKFYAYNDSWHLINDSAFTGTEASINEIEFKGYNYSAIRLDIYAGVNNVISNGYWVNMNRLIIANKDEYTSPTFSKTYMYEMVSPENDKEYLGLTIPIQSKTDNINESNFNYYLIPHNNPNINFNYETGEFNKSGIMAYKYTDAYDYLRYQASQSFLYDYSDYVGVYTESNISKTFILSRNINIFRMGEVESITFENVKDSLLGNYFELKFKEPDNTDKLSGELTTYYEINIIKNGVLNKYFTFPNTDLNTKNYINFGTYQVIKESISGNTYIKIVFWDEPETSLDAYYPLIRYEQQDAFLQRVYSIYNTEKPMVLVATMDAEVYEYIDEELGRKLNFYDSTNESQIIIMPLNEEVDNPMWYIKFNADCLNPFYTPTTYYPPEMDWFNPINLTLCPEYNLIRVYDYAHSLLGTYEIILQSETNIMNMSLLSRAGNLICFANDSFNDCDFNKVNAEFFVKTIHDSETYNNFDLTILCEIEENSWDTFYAGNVIDSGTRWIPSRINYGFGEVVNAYNIPFDSDIHFRLKDYLLANKDLINLKEYEFTKMIMNSFMKYETTENRIIYLPSNTNCIIKSRYAQSELNLSVNTAYNLHSSVMNSGLYFEMRSGCFLNRYEQSDFEILGQTINFEIPKIFSFLDYYSCLSFEFIDDNSTTFYYLTFLTICLVISKVLLNLFK